MASESAKRKAEDTAELVRLELFNTDKVPNNESQLGSAASNSCMNRETERMDHILAMDSEIEDIDHTFVFVKWHKQWLTKR